MSGKINICRDNNDPFYRYKMPPIQSKTEGRGNGIKTAVLNLSDVARALARPPSYLVKFFGFELGAQTSMNEDTDRYLVNGVHESSKLQDVLDGFINKFVLCASCKNPETEIIINKDETLDRDCKACGKRTAIDPRHKLATFIAKNSDKKAGKKRRGATAQENVVGGGKTISDLAQGTSGVKETTQDEENDDDDFMANKIAAEASQLPQVAPVNDDDWAVDMSAEAIQKRAAELEGLSLEDESKSKLSDFGEWLLSFGDKENLPEDVEIYKKAFDSDLIEDSQILQVLAQALFDEDIASQIPEHAGLLRKLIADKDGEKNLLGGLERLIGLEYPDMVKSVPKILMLLYDNDLVSEEVVKDWGSKVSKKFVPKDVSKKVRKAAKPFIQWLDEAESESEEE